MHTTLAEILPSWKNGQVLDANSALTDYTVRTAGRMILGLDRAEDAAELFGAIHASHQRVVRNMQSMVRLPDWVPTRRNRTIQANVNRLDAVVRRQIEEARASGRTDSLLARLVHLRDEAGHGLEDSQIRDHVLPIFLAAYEPTATGLTWIFYLLAKHREWQQKLQAETDAYAARADADTEAGTAAWRQRPIATQVILEAMRLYPSTWLLARCANENDALPSGASIRRGCDVLTSPLLVQRDARYYDRPEEFRPERFAAGVAERRAAGEYFPFGLGPAACLGEYLARLLMSVTLEAVLERFDIELCGDDTPQMHSVNLFTMQPDRTIRLTVRERALDERECAGLAMRAA